MATFYGTLAGALAYHAARGNAAWAASTDPLRTAALVRSSAYIDGAFRDQFPGWRAAGRLQDQEWPRAGATDREGLGIDGTLVPVEVENATYEGALRELTTPGLLAPDLKPGGGVIKRVKAGSVEVEYDSNRSMTGVFQTIEQALGPILIVRSSYSGMSARA